jgi:cytoskeletal protein CcmA (bactofilin family)
VSYFSQSRPEADKRLVARHDVEARMPIAANPALTQAPSVSTLGPDMVITGNIVCAGAVHVAGRVVGDIHAEQLVIGPGAHVEGKVTAQDAVVQGTFKGTIYGNSVRLQGSALVEGEVYNRSLTVEPDVQFEGISRRIDKALEQSAAGPAEKHAPVPASAPSAEVISFSGAGASA